MDEDSRPEGGSVMIAELREFASFTPAAQRYIRRSLDVAFERQDAIHLWSRDMVEQVSIRVQARYYAALPDLRKTIPEDASIDGHDIFFAALFRLAAFDLGQNRISSFGAFRFLYERLLGASVRPWLPAAFCGAAAMPHLDPERRRLLLQSISEAAATAHGWSSREPSFFPEWVEKIEA
jgi:hypothetical protein